MDAKQYLRKVKRIDSFIKAKQEELEMLRGKAEGVGSINLSPDKIQSSHNQTQLQDNVISMLECEEKVNKAIHDLRTFYFEVVEKINELDNEDYKLLLELRYLNMKEWEYIAVEMKYSYSHTLFLHKKALEAFQQKHSDFLNKKKDSR